LSLRNVGNLIWTVEKVDLRVETMSRSPRKTN